MFLKSKVFFAENVRVKVTKHCLKLVKLQGWDVMFRSNLKWIKREMEIVIDLMMNFSVGSVRMQQWKMRHLQSLSLTKCRRHRLTTGDKTGGCEYNLKCWLMMDYWRIPFHFMMERWYVKTSRLSRVLKSKKESSTRDGKMLELHMTLIDFSRQSGLGFSFYFPLPPPPPRRLLILYVIFFCSFLFNRLHFSLVFQTY